MDDPLPYLETYVNVSGLISSTLFPQEFRVNRMNRGMHTVWVMGNSAQALKLPTPEVEGYLTFGGNVYGNKTHAPSVVHFYDDWVDQQ